LDTATVESQKGDEVNVKAVFDPSRCEPSGSRKRFNQEYGFERGEDVDNGITDLLYR